MSSSVYIHIIYLCIISEYLDFFCQKNTAGKSVGVSNWKKKRLGHEKKNWFLTSIYFDSIGENCLVLNASWLFPQNSPLKFYHPNLEHVDPSLPVSGKFVLKQGAPYC